MTKRAWHERVAWWVLAFIVGWTFGTLLGLACNWAAGWPLWDDLGFARGLGVGMSQYEWFREKTQAFHV